ncbi:MAG: hypothetical protein WCG52_02055 [bacterium]
MIFLLRQRSSLALVLLALSALQVFGADSWHVQEALVRYQLTLSSKPTHPTCGYFVNLPDAGGTIASTMNATTAPVVMTADGTEIPSRVMWAGAQNGISLVFTSPASNINSVFVYMKKGLQPKLWSPDSGITPSAIVCMNPGFDSLQKAEQLAKFGPVEPLAHSFMQAGTNSRAPLKKKQRTAALSLGGDPSGRPFPSVVYQLSYIFASSAGPHWFAPIVLQTGTANSVRVNGTAITISKLNDKWGGTGAMVQLQQGLNRLEIFQTGSGPAHAGLCYMTWRPPNHTPDSRNETRVVDENEIARSGNCNLSGIQSRDGSPIASAQLTPTLSFWFENEDPLVIYNLKALSAANPADTNYTWIFPDKTSVVSGDTNWIFPGLADNTIKLVATSPKGTSESTISFFASPQPPADMNKPEHCAAFRDALTAKTLACGKNSSLLNAWSPACWNTIMRTIDLGHGSQLLSLLLKDHWSVTKLKLTSEQIHSLQESLLHFTIHNNPQEAIQSLEAFLANTKDPTERDELMLRAAEIYIYYLNDKTKATNLLAALTPKKTEISDVAYIRLGDIAFMEGDLNKATAYYGDIENRIRARRNATPAIKPMSGAANDPAKQKSAALQEVSFAENARTLIQGDYLIEAQQTLRSWERSFPLAKISSDYILRESEFYLKSGDPKRARAMLEAYCREIDASSFLPNAASLLIKCVKDSKESRDSVRELIEKLNARLKYHPVSAELEAFLAGK